MALHAAGIVDQHRILQIGIGDELCPQRIAWHENGTGKIALFGCDVGGRNHIKRSFRVFVRDYIVP